MSVALLRLMMTPPSTSSHFSNALVAWSCMVVWPHLNVGQPQRLSTSSTSAMVLPGSRAATLPTVSLYSISNCKSNLMLPAAEGGDMDCEGLMKARKVFVALTREHLTPLLTHVPWRRGDYLPLRTRTAHASTQRAKKQWFHWDSKCDIN